MAPTFADRLLWTLLAGTTMAAATALSRRGIAWLWRRTRGTEPPDTIGVLEALTHRTTAPVFRPQR